MPLEIQEFSSNRLNCVLATVFRRKLLPQDLLKARREFINSKLNTDKSKKPKKIPWKAIVTALGTFACSCKQLKLEQNLQVKAAWEAFCCFLSCKGINRGIEQQILISVSSLKASH